VPCAPIGRAHKVRIIPFTCEGLHFQYDIHSLSSSSPDITQLLHAASGGDESALKALFPLVYDEMHRQAKMQRATVGGHATMNTTALVHEAYLKLAGQSSMRFEDRAHFFGVAAKAMRHVFLDYAKSKTRQKRGGDAVHVDVDDVQIQGPDVTMNLEDAERIIAMDTALDTLASDNPRLARVIECRFFGGMSVEDTAAFVGTSPATVKRDWNTARARLFQLMQQQGFDA